MLHHQARAIEVVIVLGILPQPQRPAHISFKVLAKPVIGKDLIIK
jgi:hypothetical protein